jgi:uncharacterized protein (TIGR03435 family)
MQGMRGRAVAVAGLLAAGLWGQSGFEVASVRANRTGARGGSFDFPPGRDRLSLTNMPLGALILVAYDITVRQLSGASELVSERYDVQAKAEKPVSPDEMRAMIRALLADRFRFAAHRESREVPVYSITVAKGGPRLRTSSGSETAALTPRIPSRASGNEAGAGHLVFRNESMSDFAWALSRMAGIGDRVVIDRTGLDGQYDFELTFAREPAPPAIPEGPSIFSAIQEQLGLRLESGKALVAFLVIDRIERPSAN